jgi:hypothetical protein
MSMVFPTDGGGGRKIKIRPIIHMQAVAFFMSPDLVQIWLFQDKYGLP